MNDIDGKEGFCFGVDGHCFSEHQQANSVRHVVSELLGHFPEGERRARGICFLKENAVVPVGLTATAMSWRRLPGTHFSWRHLSLPRALRQSSVDVAWFPFLTVPLWLNVPSVVTIHDISFEVLRERFSWKARLYLGAMLRRALAQASRIVTISQFTADELQRVFNVPSDRLEVIHHGASESMIAPDHGREKGILEKLGLQSPYFIFLDGANSRKNLELVLQWLRTRPDTRTGEKKFVVTGNAEHIREKIVAGGCGHLLERAFVLPGLLSEDELDAVYRHADALLYLSIYEGFGLPILEAYARECPVIALRATSLPEVAGEGAIFVEPGDCLSLGEALKAVGEPGARAEMIRQGRNELQRFSWKRSADRLYEVLASVAAESVKLGSR
jgi:glycosyltransferase involved in cell wall biosynthesis